MKILIIPKVFEKYKDQLEYSIEVNLIKFLKGSFPKSSINIGYDLTKKYDPDLIIYSGGNTIKKFSSYKKDLLRDKIDNFFYKKFYKKKLLIGICHGAQFLASKYKSKIIKCKNHIRPHDLYFKNKIFKFKKIKNLKSHHHYKIIKTEILETISRSEDKSIESYIDIKNKISGIMWHPERQRNSKLQKKIFLKHYEIISTSIR